MREWEEVKEEIREVMTDSEMAKSLLKMMEIREKSIKRLEVVPLIVESYYEVIKEGLTALMCLEGMKTVSHETLVIYLNKFYKEFDDYEINFIDELRKLRNKINYQGVFVGEDYLKRNELEIKNIINKLKKIIKGKLS